MVCERLGIVEYFGFTNMMSAIGDGSTYNRIMKKWPYIAMFTLSHLHTTYFLAESLVPTARLGGDSCVPISYCILDFEQHSSNMGAGLSKTVNAKTY